MERLTRDASAAFVGVAAVVLMALPAGAQSRSASSLQTQPRLQARARSGSLTGTVMDESGAAGVATGDSTTWPPAVPAASNTTNNGDNMRRTKPILSGRCELTTTLNVHSLSCPSSEGDRDYSEYRPGEVQNIGGTSDLHTGASFLFVTLLT